MTFAAVACFLIQGEDPQRKIEGLLECVTTKWLPYSVQTFPKMMPYQFCDIYSIQIFK